MARQGTHAQARQATRRAYERFAVTIAAEYTLAQGSSNPCTILNICAGGMYIRLEDPQTAASLAADDVLTIHCRPPGTAQDVEPMAFIARIVRCEDDHCGLALTEPASPAILKLLESITKQAPQPAQRPNHYEEAAVIDPARREEILAECRKRLLRHIPPLLTRFDQAARNELFRNAEACHHASEQNAFFAAISTFADHGRRFNDEILERLSNSLTEDPFATETTSESVSTESSQLSLIEDEVVDDWLAKTDIISLAERKTQNELRGLEQRLSVVFGSPIDSDNNPYRPLVFANAFLTALDGLGLPTNANHCCHHVFRDLLASMCQDGYAEVNAYLVEQGILPELHYHISKQDRKRQNRTTAREQYEEIDELAARTTNPQWQGHTTGRMTEAADPHPSPTSYVRGGVGTATMQPHSPGPLPAADTQRDIYAIVDELEELRQDLQQQAIAIARQSPLSTNLQGDGQRPSQAQTAAASSSTTEEAPPPTAPAPACSLNDILQALDNLQKSPMIDSDDEPVEILHQVDAMLKAQYGHERQVGHRQRRVMSVGSQLFSSLLSDHIVSPQVRRWIKRLEIPLIKLALQDESLFTDRAHTGREVVNRIAQLEVYGDDEGKTSSSGIIKQIDDLVSALETANPLDESSLEKALRKLKMLIMIQDEAYQANFEDVVTGCCQEQKRLEEGEIDRDSLELLSTEGSELPPLAGDDPDAQSWLDKVHALKVDTWFMFLDRSDQPRRLKLAWIGRHRDRYVMVNLRGLRELTLTDDQLAATLRDGTALILDNADDPALDRAQYAMLQQLHHQLLYETTHDPITGLYNRHEFEKQIETSLLELGTSDDETVLCYLDLDEFRLINDTCGSQAGDRLLHDFARQLEGNLADEATIARLEGDDFALLLTVPEPEDARDVLGSLDIEDFCHEDKRYPVTFCAAILPLTSSSDDEQPTALLSRARDLCAQTRQAGQSIVVYDSGHSEPDERRTRHHHLDWMAQINDIINDEQRLELRFQPIVPIHYQSARPHHSEILLAMKDEDGRLISPQEFVMAAEHFGRMPAIDQLVVRKVMSWLRENPDLFEVTGSLAINLSGRSLNDAAFRTFLLDALQQDVVRAEQISFEVTETAGLDSLNEAADFIAEIRGLGHSFALDDFGSGMSTYGYLRQLPVDFIKIDGLFVKDLDKSQEDYVIIKSITEIGHFMGKQIIAEYVENEAILDRLREIGVDFAQGYHTGKPRLLSEIEQTSHKRAC